MAVNATAVWRVRISGSNTNGGGYDSGISGAATDYSQQNSAQANGTHGACTSSTFTDSTANAFTSLMVGNAMYITGGSSTTGWYFVVTFTNSSTVVLDRSPGSSVSGATWNLGGGWSDYITNTTSSGPLVPGNYVYILGGSSPSYSSPDYATTYFTPAYGSNTAGLIRFIGDPNTPNNNGFGGRPYLKIITNGAFFYQCSYNYIANLWIAASIANGSIGAIQTSAGGACIANNVVLDQHNNDITLTGGTAAIHCINCEVFDSTGGSGGAQFGITLTEVATVIGCNVHNAHGGGYSIGSLYGSLIGCISAKNNGHGIAISSGADLVGQMVMNNTIDGNTGHGIEFTSQSALFTTVVMNNIISNHTSSGKYGMTVLSGTTNANNFLRGQIDYNTFYNNTTDLNAISYGVHDTSSSGSAPNTISSSPYVASSTENYTLA